MGNSSFTGFFVFLSVCLGLSTHSMAQMGCQDPLATNFDPSATLTDSSCLYPSTNWSHTSRIAGLPSVLDESSSLLFTDKRLFTNTDGGNLNRIYEIDTITGQLKKTTTIWNYNNVDWEELASDSQHIYIGDFGNNDGNRTNLRVIKVKKTKIYHPDSLSIQGEAIRFFYPEQTSFVSSSTHNFDCEAFFYHQNKLHLFTKNRGNNKTTWYQMSNEPNFFPVAATRRDSLDVGGLITAASIRADGKVVALLGYNPQSLQVFVWLLFGYPQGQFFSGNRRRIDLPNVGTSGQMEGISFVDDYRIWISNEKLGSVPARVRQINIRNLIQPFFTEGLPVKTDLEKIQMLISGEKQLLRKTGNEDILVSIFQFDGRLVRQISWPSQQSDMVLPDLVPGLYLINWSKNNGREGGHLKWINR